MRRRASVWTAILGMAVLAGAAWAPAEADAISPASLVPALRVYVDNLAAGHAAATLCDPPQSLARDEAAWAKAKGILVSTLWANGFPADAVNDLTRRLKAPAPATKPDCTDQAVIGSIATPAHEGWLAGVNRAISGMQLVAVAEPVGDAQWQAIKDAIAEDTPKEARMLDCIEATLPDLMPLAVHDWDAMIAKVAEKLVDAGLPRDQITALLSAAEANALWHPAAPDALAELQRSCAADQTWSDRMYQLAFFAIGNTVDKLLPAVAR